MIQSAPEVKEFAIDSLSAQLSLQREFGASCVPGRKHSTSQLWAGLLKGDWLCIFIAGLLAAGNALSPGMQD